jgi:hypothetical protein
MRGRLVEEGDSESRQADLEDKMRECVLLRKTRTCVTRCSIALAWMFPMQA